MAKKTGQPKSEPTNVVEDTAPPASSVTEPSVSQETVNEDRPTPAVFPDTPPLAKPFMPNPTHTVEQNVLGFMESKSSSDFIKLNDFLKSLFPLSRMNEVPAWKRQHESKKLRAALDDMQRRGLLQVRHNKHLKLGSFYYDGENRTQYYDLDNVDIFAKK